MTTDWVRWHDDYDDPDSWLSVRLRLVQGHIAGWLDANPGRDLRVVSACAGQGRDLLPVLHERPADAARVRAVLLEWDARNVGIARSAAEPFPSVEVRQADAGDTANYAGAVPADLVLLAGVFGNITDDEIHATVRAVPQLAAPGATVIWTRGRWDPDPTPAIRGWFREVGCTEVAFHAPESAHISVGVVRFTGAPQPLEPGVRMFRFADSVP